MWTCMLHLVTSHEGRPFIFVMIFSVLRYTQCTSRILPCFPFHFFTMVQEVPELENSRCTCPTTFRSIFSKATTRLLYFPLLCWPEELSIVESKCSWRHGDHEFALSRTESVCTKAHHLDLPSQLVLVIHSLLLGMVIITASSIISTHLLST